MTRFSILLALFFFGLRCLADVLETEICVYGGTSAGVIAAIQATRMGKRVILLEPGYHLGGMSSGGLGATDIGNKGAIGGLARDFYRAVGKEYGKEEAWLFEPSVAERVFFSLVNTAKVPVFFAHRLAGVTRKDGTILSIQLEGGRSVQAIMYIDASYEGDLMARAGVGFTVGRESNAVYGETLNGVRESTPKHQFVVPVDPYKQPGAPASGILPLIQSSPSAPPGEGDQSVQAYNFRLCLTRDPNNQKPIEPPKGYDPARYELLGRYLEAMTAKGTNYELGSLMHIQLMPNGKTDINNNGGFSTDYIGGNYAYPNGSFADRERIRQEHEDYTRGFLHFLATNPRVAEKVRLEMQTWGLCKDEFVDTGGWPHQMYVREARRMVSDYVMTEMNCTRSLVVADPIGLAAYTMDSHNCQRLVKDNLVENEGDVQVGGFPPYPISYRSIIPKQGECGNLLVPVCLSASHIAYGSIRMEPVFMVLGQSAATAAALAIESKSTVQGILVSSLCQRLMADGQILEWKPEKN